MLRKSKLFFDPVSNDGELASFFIDFSCPFTFFNTLLELIWEQLRVKFMQLVCVMRLELLLHLRGCDI